MSLPLALQLYSLRACAQQDLPHTLQRIKQMGYDGVELAGYYGRTPREMRTLLDDAGLLAVGSHVSLQDFDPDPAAVVEACQTIGSPCVAIASMEADRLPGGARYAQTRELFVRYAQACQAGGIQFLYHNHDFEFVTLPDGRYALDALYEDIPASLLQSEIDTCWVHVAGVDPAAYLRKFATRAPIVHLKDFIMDGRGRGCAPDLQVRARQGFDYRPLGCGAQDVAALLAAATDAGCRCLVVEQDESSDRPAMEACAVSAAYVRGLLGR